MAIGEFDLNEIFERKPDLLQAAFDDISTHTDYRVGAIAKHYLFAVGTQLKFKKINLPRSLHHTYGGLAGYSNSKYIKILYRRKDGMPFGIYNRNKKGYADLITGPRIEVSEIFTEILANEMARDVIDDFNELISFD